MIAWLTVGARLIGHNSEVARRGLESLGEMDDVQRLIGHRPTRAIERVQHFFDLLRCSRQPQSAERMMTLDLRMGLADDLLLYTDKITMHHSLECRVPFLDLELVRYAESLPLEYRVGLFNSKVLHRQYARRLLPAAIVRRKKKGFLSPTRVWFKDTGLLRETLLEANSGFALHFNLSEVDRILREHAAGMNRERHIFLLLSLRHWFATLPSQEPAMLTCGATAS
jgi:asparagine synthase (glutamine-hydrolysing)